jgi:UDPglucose 6-dehydrogenase
MNITIFGSGYVGLVTGACFAEVGNTVTCVDIDAERVARLNAGECLIHEPGLQQILSDNLAAGRLRFVSDVAHALDADVFFIAVGTPAKANGAADLSYVENVAKTLGELLIQPALVVDKSTVPVGTAAKVKCIINQALRARGMEFTIDVASNPEFLKEGHAVDDFMKPDRVVIGVSSDAAEARLRQLYAPFNRQFDKVIAMDVRSAELTKYVANAMLATKISFMNEMSRLADSLGADIELVRQGIGSDPRIGYQFIYPGCGYGGSCFPKDVQALVHAATEQGVESPLITATHQVNERQKNWLFEKMLAFYGKDLRGKRIAVWGLAFKPNTDDIREAPSVFLINKLLQAGAKVSAFDPKAAENVRNHFNGVANLMICDSSTAVLKNADALAIMTEWMEFRSPDFLQLADTLRDKVIFDGRNLYAPEQVAGHGLSYLCIGRPDTLSVAVAASQA